MDRRILVINNSAVTKVYGGQEIGAGQTYELQSDAERLRMMNSDELISDIYSAVASISNGTAAIAEASAAHSWLMGWEPHDPEMKPYMTQSMTKLDWYYSPHSLDFYTAKAGSLYNRKHDGALIDDGTDPGDAWMQFYNASGTELVQGESESDEDYQTRLSTDCVKTIMSWEKQESFDVLGAYLYIKSSPASRAYFWVVAAPDIPYENGGSKPYMGRGLNLQMMAPGVNHYFDAKTTKTVGYDTVYHSGKVAAVVKHGAGEQIGLQLIFICYEE